MMRYHELKENSTKRVFRSMDDKKYIPQAQWKKQM